MQSRCFRDLVTDGVERSHSVAQGLFRGRPGQNVAWAAPGGVLRGFPRPPRVREWPRLYQRQGRPTAVATRSVTLDPGSPGASAACYRGGRGRIGAGIASRASVCARDSLLISRRISGKPLVRAAFRTGKVNAWRTGPDPVCTGCASGGVAVARRGAPRCELASSRGTPVDVARPPLALQGETWTEHCVRQGPLVRAGALG